VLIANLMLQPADILLMDEPTNDLYRQWQTWEEKSSK
jgi:ATPase subunit of ABC transporter with duplicated ATPase domains